MKKIIMIISLIYCSAISSFAQSLLNVYTNSSLSNVLINDSVNNKIISLPDVIITAQLAIDRKTPVASSTVQSIEIEERLGSKELPEILQYYPGVYVSKQGGGWGDSEIFMRGFDNSNIAVMVNGIPVNDMETGTVYWSNWESLGEVASLIQVQRGIGVSKVSSPSVGGTINIITKGLEAKGGGSVSYSAGNDGFQKIGFSINTGLIGKGWALTLLGSQTKGNGYVQGTNFKVYNYFFNISKRINEKNQISLTAFGAPQEHYMRSNALKKSEWEKIKNNYQTDKHWTRYNPDYGVNTNGKRKSVDYNKYHNPMFSLKHIWLIDNKSNLTTNAYAVIGRGISYSGLANSDDYREYDWYGADYGVLNTKFRCDDGTFNYAKIEELNKNSTNGSQMIITNTIGNHDFYGLMSTYSNQFLDCIDFFTGIDFRYYESLHQNTIQDLFGGSYFIDPARNEVNIENNQNATDEWKQQQLKVGDVVYRDYVSHIVQEGFFGQLEYSKNKINTFLSGALNYSHYWRVDGFYYDNVRSNTIGFWGGNIKSGINYNVTKRSNLFLNFGYNSRAPQFKSGAFMSATSSNVTNKMAKNEKSTSVEFGYIFRNSYLTLKTNGYYTRWMDKSMAKKGKLTDQYYINMTGVDSRHFGLEFELKATPVNWIELGAMLSLGDWKWDTDNIKGYAYNINGQAITPEGDITTPDAENHAWALINMKGINIGGSAQTTAAIDVTFKPFTGFRIGGGCTFFDRNYAYYSLSGSNLSLGKELYVVEPYKIPFHTNFELWSSYKFALGKTFLTFSGQVDNLLNQFYIEKAWNPTTVSQEPINMNPDDVYLFYSKGRTWIVKLKVDF